MRFLCLPLAVLIPLTLMGCSTSGVAPKITDFAKATSEAAKAGEAPGSGLSVTEAELRDARRRTLVAHQAIYLGFEGSKCELTAIAAQWDFKPLSETCKLEPVILDNGRETIVATPFDTPEAQNAAERILPALERDQPLRRRYAASLLLKELGTYAAALGSLATSDAPETVATEVSASIGSLSDLHAAIAALDKARGKPAPAQPAYKTLGKLLQNLTAEALETRRYALLKSLVEANNDTVRLASIQLALISAETAKLSDLDKALEDLSYREDFGSLTWMKDVEAAHAALIAADAKADYRAYSDIGAAHVAILESLRAPASAEQLLEANKRIQSLVSSVENYKTARN
ncbi:hypothetical protein SAMN06297129_0948 [Pseudooceanicola antarcticus]|uniref:Uncharacterized protein n=2 Tax=Pseudooceanicola antarcticus TaxID=1247613 RepID=A0A285IEG1_9RHOB|nr:hypothetical protein SAMN06297129_0948 [Pseudooceanicola antarcticus]